MGGAGCGPEQVAAIVRLLRRGGDVRSVGHEDLTDEFEPLRSGGPEKLGAVQEPARVLRDVPVAMRTLQHHDVRRCERTQGQRGRQEPPVLHQPRRLDAARRGDDHRRLRVVDAGGEIVESRVKT